MDPAGQLAAAATEGGRQAAARRAPEHRAARRARAGARGQLHHRSQSAPAARATSSRDSTTTPACCAQAYRTLADDVRTGQFVTSAAEWLLDNFHLVTAEIADIRQQSPAHLLPRSCRRSPSREHAGHARIYAMAVELVRHSDSRLDRQQLTHFLNSYQRVAPLTIGELWAWPSMLKLALIENLRRLADEMLSARAARRRRRLRRAGCDDGRRHAGSRLPAGPRRGVRRAVAAPHPRVRAAAVLPIRTAVDEHLASRQTTAEDGDSRRAPAPGRDPGVGRQRHHEPSAVLDARLARVRRVGQPRRAGAAARSGGRLRTHGFPQPRSAAPGGRGTGARRAARRRCGSRCGRSRAPVRRRRRVDRGSGGARRLPPRSDAGRRDLEADVAYRPRLAGRLAAPRVRSRDGVSISGRSRVLTALLARRRRRLRPERGRVTAGSGSRWRCCVAAAGERHRDRAASSGSSPARPPRRLPRLDFSERRSRRARARWSIVPTMLTSVDWCRRAGRASRGARARQPRSRASTSPS